MGFNEAVIQGAAFREIALMSLHCLSKDRLAAVEGVLVEHRFPSGCSTKTVQIGVACDDSILTKGSFFRIQRSNTSGP